MKLKSALKPKAYLSAMKEHMEGHFAFCRARFTGFFFGRFFSVTYHSGYEWNRRITNEKNTAMGIVKETEDGSLVRFVQIKGLLAPTQFLFTFCWLYLTFLLVFAIKGFAGLELGMMLGIAALLCLVCTVIAALISLFTDSITEAGQDGERTMMCLLMDPVDPYSHY